jgi:hypothetical protein
MLSYCIKLWNTDSEFYSCVIIKLINSNIYSITVYSILYKLQCNNHYSVPNLPLKLKKPIKEREVHNKRMLLTSDF